MNGLSQKARREYERFISDKNWMHDLSLLGKDIGGDHFGAGVVY